MNYYIASLLIACIGPSTYSVNIPGVIIGFWAWGIIVMGIAYVDNRVVRGHNVATILS
jgi:hypothetical protein